MKQTINQVWIICRYEIYSTHYYYIVGVRRKYQYIQTTIISSVNLDNMVNAGIVKQYHKQHNVLTEFLAVRD